MVENFAYSLAHQQFEVQAAQTPDAIAIVDQGRQFTYQQLNARANQLAHYLQKHQVGPDTLVGVCLRRSPSLIIALLAILKAGGAYIPLDPEYPVERLAMMREDSQLALLLTTRHNLSDWMTSSKAIELDTQWDDITKESTQNLDNSIQPNHLAYIIYTSGSTGKPKGVMIEHGSLAAYVETAAVEYAINPDDRVLQFASVSFDTSAEEIYPCLARGATLVLRTNEMIGSAQSFLKQSQAWNITVWNLPTAFWHFLATELARLDISPPPSLRLVIIGGEKALATRLELWQQQVESSVRLVNTYGPTETTIVATMCDLAGPHAVTATKELPIGKAIPQSQLYILDEQLKRVHPGTAGNLYIGGTGVARGYLNRPHLTAERFVINPFSQPSVNALPERIYQTGDRVRDRGDGLLEFLGRNDHQVKIRGFRVELFEIEAVLNQHPDVCEGIVLAKSDALGNQRLVAYILPEHSSKRGLESWVATMRNHLKATLPDYMVPSLFLVLNSLPLTPSGKVDRKALPEPEQAQQQAAESYQTPLEKDIASLWFQVLKIPVNHSDDSFFELGGNSLLAAHLVSLLKEELDIELPVRCIYETPTVAGLAQTVKTIQQSGNNTLTLLTDLKTQPIPTSPKIVTRKPILADLTSPENIFLTGATGFLGAFLLYELIKQTNATIYCLVRGKSRYEGLRRLRANFAKYSLPAGILAKRIVPVSGSLDQPQFGLSMVQFSRLANTIDVIYHSGAMVNFVKPYSALEDTNVQGTHQILKLACQGKLKPINHISTVGVFGATAYFTGRPTVYENDDLNLSRDFLCWDDGYAQTKWVAEKLVLDARRQGIPITVFRPGFIMGSSQTGATNPNDFLSRSIKGCIQLGYYPDLANFKNQVVTVDYASRAIVHLSQQSSLVGQTFHLSPWSASTDLAWNDLFECINRYGYSMEKLTYSHWTNKLNQQCQESQTNALYPLLPFLNEKVYKQELTILELYENTSDFDCQNTMSGLENSNISCPIVDMDLIYTYLTELNPATDAKKVLSQTA